MRDLLREGIRSKSRFTGGFKEIWRLKGSGSVHRLAGPAYVVWLYKNGPGVPIRHHKEWWFHGEQYTRDTHPYQEFINQYDVPREPHLWTEDMRILFITIYG
jgi:hypothetical protein